MKYTIKQARVLADYTQVEMANLLGMSESAYIKYEQYKRVLRFNIATQFADIVGMKTEQIIFFTDEQQKICSLKRDVQIILSSKKQKEARHESVG